MTVTRKMIEELIQKINKAENIRPHSTIEETVSAIDAVCAPDFKGSLNGGPLHDREAERQSETMLFSMLIDYHRSIGKVIIDPPFAAFEWAISGTVKGIPIKVNGCSVIECDEKGMLRLGRVYVDTTQLSSGGK